MLSPFRSQRRGLILPSLAFLSQSKWFKTIREVDQFQDPTYDPETSASEQTTTKVTFPERTPDGRILISDSERSLMFIISGIQALLHHENGANINNFGEVSAFECVLRSLRDQMLSTREGRRILRERPQLTSKELDVNWLKSLPPNTLGAQYAKFTADNDDRAPVRFIQDEELSYVFLRYRQMHDIVHILTGCKVDLAGELPVKAFEFGNTGLPMTGLACFAYFKLSSKRKAKVNMIDSFLNGLSATSLITVPWERVMDKDVDELRAQYGIHQ
ncbi:ubiquinone biosynthesis protein COQ4 [Cyberlindnera jadinii NRRL Y-1542]|uniref:4-hydroxy-3-methoxy-5-polyprenylbenzoate decarboxylase n=1 Tax=Cyberlindnera jadinii (strain ATCC 18201 / CBS 1600 / BCRC 20928 / JCM 3617 / NBRC 0987 / NRRL Y-1542) TaxID=983966 RepID=A0A1E4S4W7_CYBJN|nr:Coq4-domain-containing protein [Cyberlindnera jadinii NRRL Y-1542]ODV74493.1 Coq4-domain-containing protein [Cyberlindnera jadinii NRRL Y-1542]